MSASGISPIYFGGRRAGPEARLEDTIVSTLTAIMPTQEVPKVVLGSRPIGAGAPDLTIIYGQRAPLLPSVGLPVLLNILAYLRVVSFARPETLMTRLSLHQPEFEASMELLLGVGALKRKGGALQLGTRYREPIREIVTIEAKVSKWRHAVSQAARNRAFAHRSFVALPPSQARLAAADKRVAMLGIGVISVDGHKAQVLRRSRRAQPRVWRYYFELAHESVPATS